MKVADANPVGELRERVCVRNSRDADSDQVVDEVAEYEVLSGDRVRDSESADDEDVDGDTWADAVSRLLEAVGD